MVKSTHKTTQKGTCRIVKFEIEHVLSCIFLMSCFGFHCQSNNCGNLRGGTNILGHLAARLLCKPKNVILVPIATKKCSNQVPPPNKSLDDF